jgi:hypothetical protein
MSRKWGRDSLSNKEHSMPLRIVALGAVAAGLFLAGCGPAEEEAELDPAALEAAFAGAEAPIESAPAGEETTTDVIRLPTGEAAEEVSTEEIANRAADAMRKDEVTEAMVLLQTLRRARNLSADQLTAVQDQMAALQMSLANRAASGDQRAQQALDLIQRSTRW